jgi:hypothetical protein
MIWGGCRSAAVEKATAFVYVTGCPANWKCAWVVTRPLHHTTTTPWIEKVIISFYG